MQRTKNGWQHSLPTKNFLQILAVQHLYILFQLVLSFKKCSFVLEQHVSMVSYSAEFVVLKFLSKTETSEFDGKAP